MNKKRNRGVTLTELIISIALISIVVTFLFNLLVDVRSKEKGTDFNRKNQQQRAIVLKRIQEDFIERVLIGMEDKSVGDTLILDLKYEDGTTGKIQVENTAITYTIDGETEKWELIKQNNNTFFNTTCINYQNSLYEENNSEFFSIKFTIPVVVQKNSSNVLDDFEFYYVGLKGGFSKSNFPDPTEGYLGNCEKNND